MVIVAEATALIRLGLVTGVSPWSCYPIKCISDRYGKQLNQSMLDQNFYISEHEGANIS